MEKVPLYKLRDEFIQLNPSKEATLDSFFFLIPFFFVHCQDLEEV